MAAAEIDVRKIKVAVNAILEHLIEDLKVAKFPLEEDENLYWDVPFEPLFDMSKQPTDLSVGSLRDDIDFVKNIERGQSADITYNLIHVVPLLRHIAEKIKS